MLYLSTLFGCVKMNPRVAVLVLAVFSGCCNAQSCNGDDDAPIKQWAETIFAGQNIQNCADAATYCAEVGGMYDALRSTCCETCCTNDNDIGLVERISADIPQFSDSITMCSDAQAYCSHPDFGPIVKYYCCATCAPAIDAQLELPRPDNDNPVHLFLLGGQSEAAGAASTDMLVDDTATYPRLASNMSNVWLAGAFSSMNNQFMITLMEAGKEKRLFGPEISFAERIQSVTGKRVMVVKYAWGGSSVREHWNPDTPDNTWDKDADDGTAAWLMANGGVDFQNKRKLFVNQVYVSRSTTEALDTAGVAYEWKGIVWLQGTSDRLQTWATFGEDTARVFEAMRTHTVGIHDLPIVDNGADSAQGSLVSGKHYAAQIVAGCNTVYVDVYGSIPRFCDKTANNSQCCVTTASDACLQSSFANIDMYNFYGWDPLYETIATLPENATSNRFAWYRDFPADLHSEYEGMILKGRMLANTYLRTFSPGVALPREIDANDPSLLFPLPRCPRDTHPTQDFLCWMDERSEEEASRVCQPPPHAGDIFGPTNTAVALTPPTVLSMCLIMLITG